jgi:hypothetical protein
MKEGMKYDRERRKERIRELWNGCFVTELGSW